MNFSPSNWRLNEKCLKNVQEERERERDTADKQTTLLSKTGIRFSFGFDLKKLEFDLLDFGLDFDSLISHQERANLSSQTYQLHQMDANPQASLKLFPLPLPFLLSVSVSVSVSVFSHYIRSRFTFNHSTLLVQQAHQSMPATRRNRKLAHSLVV